MALETFENLDEGVGIRAKLNQAILLHGDAVSVALPTGVDDSAAFSAAMALSNIVFVPYSATAYRVTPQTLTAGIKIIGQADRRPTINIIGNGHAFTTGGDGCALENLIIDGQDATRGSGMGVYCSHDDFELTNVKIINCPQEGAYFIDCSSPRVSNCEISDNGSSGATFENADDWKLQNSTLSGNTNFGCFAWKASRNGVFKGNKGVANGLEMYGQQFDCYQNLISENQSESAGDNGLSINGYYNRVIGNRVKNATFHGIAVYGSGNTISDNIISNSGQVNNGSVFCGITVIPAWGGFARDNAIGENQCFDDQVAPTQHYACQLLGNQYTAWSNGVAVTSNSILSRGDNLYRARNSGTTATGSEPSHTSGTATGADGVTWVYCGSRQRTLYERQRPWVASTAVALGALLYSGNSIYYVSVAGTTSASAPVHTTGSAANGTATLLWVRTVPTDFASNANIVGAVVGWGNKNEGILDSGTGNIRRDRDQLGIRIPGTTLTAELYVLNVDPAGVQAGRPGSIATRTNGSVRSKVAQIKNSGTGTAGWLSLAIRDSGTTANRPTAEMIAGSEGYNYFDTTLGKCIWWSGSTWVDATGTAA